MCQTAHNLDNLSELQELLKFCPDNSKPRPVFPAHIKRKIRSVS